MEQHTIISIRDEKKFQVFVTEAPSGARFQWAVRHGTMLKIPNDPIAGGDTYGNIIGGKVSTDELNHHLYDLVEND